MKSVRVHCMTNPVTMQDVANILLAVGASPIMALDRREAAEIALRSDALLLNTGVPNDEKWAAWECAGMAAEKGGRPVVLDPVGAGASRYRAEGLRRLLGNVHPQIIRCNRAEASALLDMTGSGAGVQRPGMQNLGLQEAEVRETETGVDSFLDMSSGQAGLLASELAKRYGCTVLMSGEEDIVSDGERLFSIGGGDARIRKITGGGCMLSALCAWRLGAGDAAFQAAEYAAGFWRSASAEAGRRTDSFDGFGSGIGTFHICLFDAASNFAALHGERQQGGKDE